jgi:hypothetical protein
MPKPRQSTGGNRAEAIAASDADRFYEPMITALSAGRVADA